MGKSSWKESFAAIAGWVDIDWKDMISRWTEGRSQLITTLQIGAQQPKGSAL